MTGILTASDQTLQLIGAGTGGPVDFDATLFFMLALFLGLMVLFNRILFQPYLQVRDTRQKRIQGAKVESREMDETARLVFTEYEEKLAAAVRAGEAERRAMRDRVKLEQREVMAGARREVDGLVVEAKDEIDAELAQAETQLYQHAQELAAVIVEKVLA